MLAGKAYMEHHNQIDEIVDKNVGQTSKSV